MIFKMDLCQYKDAFGKPGPHGLRKYRLFGIAVFDVSVTMFCVWILTWFTKTNYWITLIGVFILGIFVHRLFCVRTAVDKMVFPN
jgi:hypothetical protein